MHASTEQWVTWLVPQMDLLLVDENSDWLHINDFYVQGTPRHEGTASTPGDVAFIRYTADQYKLLLYTLTKLYCQFFLKIVLPMEIPLLSWPMRTHKMFQVSDLVKIYIFLLSMNYIEWSNILCSHSTFKLHVYEKRKHPISCFYSRTEDSGKYLLIYVYVVIFWDMKAPLR